MRPRRQGQALHRARRRRSADHRSPTTAPACRELAERIFDPVLHDAARGRGHRPGAEHRAHGRRRARGAHRARGRRPAAAPPSPSTCRSIGRRLSDPEPGLRATGSSSATPAAGPAMRPRPCRAPRAPCVLVVDDEPEITRVGRRAARARLRGAHRQLRRRGAGAAEDHSVAVILTDQRMPGGTGAELLARSLDIAPETTRILFTGYSDISAVIDAVNEGQVYHYLTKPWQPEELKAVVEPGRRALPAGAREPAPARGAHPGERGAGGRQPRAAGVRLLHRPRPALAAARARRVQPGRPRRLRRPLDETGKDYLARIRAASQRMAELFDAQLALAQTGHRPVELVEVDVTAARRAHRRRRGGTDARAPWRSPSPKA